MREFESTYGRQPICWWTQSMYELCWKQFRITSVYDHEKWQVVNWHGTDWSISSDMIKRVDEPIKKWDTVRVKSLEQIHDIISDGNRRYWNSGDGMRGLCGRIFEVDKEVSDSIYIWGYFVHKDFLERVPADDATKSAPVPRFATEHGPIYTDRCTDGVPMSIRDLHDSVCDWDPAPEKKKSRIQFSKIR